MVIAHYQLSIEKGGTSQKTCHYSVSGSSGKGTDESKGMQNIFVKRLSGLLCAWLFPFAALYAQVDTTTYHQLSGVEVLGKVRPSTTRESTPLQVMDKAGIERLGVQDLSEAVKRFSGVTVQD